MKSPKIHHVLVYTEKEGIPGCVVDFSIHVAGAAIGLRPASKNKEMWKQKILQCVFYCCCRARKKRYIVRDFFEKYSYVLLIDGGAVKKHLATVPEKADPTTLNHIYFQRQRQSQSRSLEDTETSVALPHCSESTRDSIAGWWTF